MTHTYKPESICAYKIDFELEGDIVKNIKFYGGCNGNLKAVAKLLEGQTVDYIEQKLRGNTCGAKATSCADQLAIAVRQAYENQK